MKKIKQTALRKATVVIILNDRHKTIISGEGKFEGKKLGNTAIFTATLIKEITKPVPHPKTKG